MTINYHNHITINDHKRSLMTINEQWTSNSTIYSCRNLKSRQAYIFLQISWHLIKNKSFKNKLENIFITSFYGGSMKLKKIIFIFYFCTFQFQTQQIYISNGYLCSVWIHSKRLLNKCLKNKCLTICNQMQQIIK